MTEVRVGINTTGAGVGKPGGRPPGETDEHGVICQAWMDGAVLLRAKVVRSVHVAVDEVVDDVPWLGGAGVVPQTRVFRGRTFMIDAEDGVP